MFSTTPSQAGWFQKNIGRHWEDAKKSAKHHWENIVDNAENLSQELANLNQEIIKVKDQIDQVKIETPKIDWTDLKVKIQGPRMDDLKIDKIEFGKIGSIKDIKIGGEIGRLTNKIKKEVSIEKAEDVFSHWGTEILKCSGEILSGSSLCNYTETRCEAEGAEDIVYRSNEEESALRCKNKEVENSNKRYKALLVEKRKAIKAKLLEKTESLRKQLDKYKEVK